MKHIKRLLALFLTLVLLLGVAACGDEATESGDSSSEESIAELSADSSLAESTESSQAESSEESSEPPPPPEPTAAEVFSDAAAFWAEAGNYHHEIEVVSERYIGSIGYTDEIERTADYIGVGTDGFCVSVAERLIHLDEVLRYAEQYKDGKAYFQFDGESTVYESVTEADAYMTRIMPAVILDPALYETVEFDNDDKTAFRFENATAPEGWIDCDSMLFETASGKAIMSDDGIIEKMEYTAVYYIGPAMVSETYTVTLSESELTAEEIKPLTGDTTVEITDIALPMILDRAINSLITIPYCSANLSETLQSDALGVYYSDYYSLASIMMEDGDTLMKFDFEYYFYSSDDESEYSESMLYRDGVMTYSENGSEYVESDYEYDVILSNAMNRLCSVMIAELEDMENLQITDIGDFWILEYDIEDKYAKMLEQHALAMVLTDPTVLDPYISAFEFDTLTGALSIDKDTGFLTAANFLLKAEHVIEGERFPFTYEHGLSFHAGDIEAYEFITEEIYPDTEPPEEEKAKPLFYEVTDDNGNKLYLLGTIHLGDDRTAFLPDEIYAALDEADALAVEMNLNTLSDRVEEDEDLHKAYMESYFYQDETKLIDHVGEELYEDARKRMFASGYGNYSEIVRPATVDSLYTQYLLETCDYLLYDKGVDQRLLDLADESGKKVYEIEDVKDHLLSFNYMTEDTQRMILEMTAEYTRAQAISEVLWLYEVWCSGDIESFKMYFDQETPDDSELTEEEKAFYEDYNQHLMANRDQIMFDGIKKYLASGETVFVAVGAAHVLGDGGLVDMLEEAGYTVTLVEYQ